MSESLVTEADVRKLLTKEENTALDLAFEAIDDGGFSYVRGPNSSPSEWIDRAFSWADSPQGLKYWEHIHLRLSGLIDPYYTSLSRVEAQRDALLSIVKRAVIQLEILLPKTGRVNDERMLLIDAAKAIAAAEGEQ